VGGSRAAVRTLSLRVRLDGSRLRSRRAERARRQILTAGCEHFRLPGALEGGLALGFLCCEDGLALGFGLTRDFGETFCFCLAGGFGRFSSEPGGNLGFFLGFALGFFFLAAAFFGLRFFYAKAGFFSSLCAGSGEVAILGAVQIGPGIKSGHILRSGGFAVGDRF